MVHSKEAGQPRLQRRSEEKAIEQDRVPCCENGYVLVGAGLLDRGYKYCVMDVPPLIEGRL